jgi:predicted transcriptional regulator
MRYKQALALVITRPYTAVELSAAMDITLRNASEVLRYLWLKGLVKRTGKRVYGTGRPAYIYEVTK